MDNNPVYREKYLKYKKKYLELKALEEEIDGGSIFSSLKKSALSVTGNSPQDKFNKNVLKVMEKQVKEEESKANEMLKDLEKSQQSKVLKNFKNEFSNSLMSKGPVTKAIKATKGYFDASGVKINEITEEEQFALILKETHNVDSLSELATKMISDGIKSLYEEVTKDAKETTKEHYKPGNDEETIKSIVGINQQNLLDKICEKNGLDKGFQTCTQDKIDVLKIALAKLEENKKTFDTNINQLDKSEKTRKNGQDEINKIAAVYGIEGESNYAQVKEAIEKKLEESNKKVASDIGISIDGTISKESLIVAINQAEKVILNKEEKN